MKSKPSIYPLRLPHSLRVAIEKVSREDGTSINRFVVTAVAEKLSAMQTARFFEERREQSDLAQARRMLSREGGREPDQDDLLP